MNILVINCGSSSLKFSVIDTESGNDLARGLFDKLGSSNPSYKLESSLHDTPVTGTLTENGQHEEALERLAEYLNSDAVTVELKAVGHRIVHGGEHFTSACLLDEKALAAVSECGALAPLHNPANLLGIKTSQQHFPSLPQIGVFDTAFHQTLPRESYLYAIPYQLYKEHRIRRYGFHGTSHKYVAGEAAKVLGKEIEHTSLITAHLGNGCSAAAIENGQSVDTTMGLTPLEGLVMGTRSGDIDPAVLIHLNRSLGMGIDEIDTMLNKKSGLLGLSEFSNDMRSLREASSSGNASAKLAVDIFTRRLAKSIAALRTSIDECDALVFTGGIGENDWQTRQETALRLKYLGVEIDAEANHNGGAETKGVISRESSSLKVLVVRTNEELMIARETAKIVENL